MTGNDVQDPFSPQRCGRSALWQRGSDKQQESPGSTFLLPGSPAAKSFVLVLHLHNEHPTFPASLQTLYKTAQQRDKLQKGKDLFSLTR